MNSEDYVASVTMYAGPFWLPGMPSVALCDGSLKSIAQYNAYYSVVGTLYGGDGRATVGVPDLRSRAPFSYGQGPGLTNHTPGQMGGAQQRSVTLTNAQLPVHSHLASFNTQDLHGSASTVADTSASQVGGTLRCNNTSGGATDPNQRYPGTSSDPSVNTWASVTDSQMAADLMIDGTVTELNVSTSFSNTKIPVTVGNFGSGEAYEVPTALPVTAVNYMIVLDGPYPNRNS